MNFILKFSCLMLCWALAMVAQAQEMAEIRVTHSPLEGWQERRTNPNPGKNPNFLVVFFSERVTVTVRLDLSQPSQPQDLAQQMLARRDSAAFTGNSDESNTSLSLAGYPAWFKCKLSRFGLNSLNMDGQYAVFLPDGRVLGVGIGTSNTRQSGSAFVTTGEGEEEVRRNFEEGLEYARGLQIDVLTAPAAPPSPSPPDFPLIWVVVPGALISAGLLIRTLLGRPAAAPRPTPASTPAPPLPVIYVLQLSSQHLDLQPGEAASLLIQLWKVDPAQPHYEPALGATIAVQLQPPVPEVSLSSTPAPARLQCELTLQSPPASSEGCLKVVATVEGGSHTADVSLSWASGYELELVCSSECLTDAG